MKQKHQTNFISNDMKTEIYNRIKKTYNIHVNI